jgi:hypothetical protein
VVSCQSDSSDVAGSPNKPGPTANSVAARADHLGPDAFRRRSIQWPRDLRASRHNKGSQKQQLPCCTTAQSTSQSYLRLNPRCLSYHVAGHTLAPLRRMVESLALPSTPQLSRDTSSTVPGSGWGGRAGDGGGWLQRKWPHPALRLAFSHRPCSDSPKLRHNCRQCCLRLTFEFATTLRPRPFWAIRANQTPA